MKYECTKKVYCPIFNFSVLKWFLYFHLGLGGSGYGNMNDHEPINIALDLITTHRGHISALD